MKHFLFAALLIAASLRADVSPTVTPIRPGAPCENICIGSTVFVRSELAPKAKFERMVDHLQGTVMILVNENFVMVNFYFPADKKTQTFKLPIDVLEVL